MSIMPIKNQFFNSNLPEPSFYCFELLLDLFFVMFNFNKKNFKES